MPANIATIVAELDALTALDEEVDLIRLQKLIDAYFEHPQRSRYLDVWFRLFERFPEQDGFGVFWSILHALEEQPNCDALVVSSVHRRPSRFPVLMLNRILNSGVHRVGNCDLLGLLKSVATNTEILNSVRDDAWRFLRHQRNGID